MKFKFNFRSLFEANYRSTDMRVMWSLLLLSIIHRFMASRFLHTSDVTQVDNLVRESIIGVWGDLWVCFLLTLPFFIVGLVTPKSRWISKAACLWVLVWTILTAAHQGYVEYFRQQIIPFHLEYMTDRSFMNANIETLFASRSAIILGIGMILSLGPLFFRKPEEKRKRAILEFVVVAIIATFAHAANIRWRVQWFIPESMQTHFLEQLYANLETKHTSPRLSDEERAQLAKISATSSIDSIQSLLSPSSVQTTSPQLLALMRRFNEIRSKGNTPMIAVILAESLRPADIGWTRSDYDPDSITPNLDLFVKSGVNFTNAYSTGPVTRGGQEAVWCGVSTATNTSLMRSFPLFKLACMGDRAKSVSPSSKLFWMHGGDTRFDGQKDFWAHHGIDSFLTADNFDRDTPQTGWGVSDLAFFEHAAATLNEESKTKLPLLLPMILSVTNHIPWELPEDAPESIRQLEVEHESHLTTAYFDFALGKFVTAIKRSGLWKKSIIIVVSDHGGLEFVRNHSYKEDHPLKWEHLASHINLTLTGGIVEDLVTAQKLPNTVDTFVSQAQIAPFIATIASLENSEFMDTALFGEHSPWPVASDLNQYLFLPEDEQKISKEDVLTGDLNHLTGNARIATLRYRAFLQMLYEFKPES